MLGVPLLSQAQLCLPRQDFMLKSNDPNADHPSGHEGQETPRKP